MNGKETYCQRDQIVAQRDSGIQEKCDGYTTLESGNKKNTEVYQGG